MKKVLAKKYTDPKWVLIVLSIILIILILGIVALCFWLIWEKYSWEVASYREDLWFYENGYSSYKPVYPKAPIFWYVFTGVISSALIGVYIWLIIYFYKKQARFKDDVIIYDSDSLTFEVLSKKGSRIIPIASIQNIKVENMGFIPAYYVTIPYKRSYGKIVITYLSNGEKLKIKTISVQQVEEVAIKMQALMIANKGL